MCAADGCTTCPPCFGGVDAPRSFALGPINTNDCPGGYTHILDKSLCSDAVAELKKTNPTMNDGLYYEHDWGTDRPSGCFWYRGNNAAHFNPGAGGNGKGNDQPICKNS